MKMILNCLVGMFGLLSGCCNEQPRKADNYSDYISIFFEYETNLHYVATDGQQYWADILKDTRIPLERKMDLVGTLCGISQPNEQMAQKVREMVKQDVPKPILPEDEDYDDPNWKFCVLLIKARDKHDFHEAFLIFNYIDTTLLYSEVEGVGEREIAVLTELTALHGECEWNAILTDKNVDIGLKRGLVIDIHDMAKYGEYNGKEYDRLDAQNGDKRNP